MSRRHVKQSLEVVAAGELISHAVTEEHLDQRLSLADLPEPDLFIRTGGDSTRQQFYALATCLHRTIFYSNAIRPKI
jgi:undecaprenyl diphosphate synthase